LIVGTLLACSTDGYFADWGDVGGRGFEPTCVDIPSNMALCSNIEYTRMRLPNLLAHDTLEEVAHQSAQWVPLMTCSCHRDTQLFLCSLFTPVCLEAAIFPCRSLCTAVKTSCQPILSAYGFSWPDMLACDRFPEDNDMCIRPQHTESTVTLPNTCPGTNQGPATGPSTNQCAACPPEAPPLQEIREHFLQADFAIRLKFRNIRNGLAKGRRAKIYKPAAVRGNTSVRALRQSLRHAKLQLVDQAACCGGKLRSGQRYLVLGGRGAQGGLVPSLVLPLGRKNKMVRMAMRQFASLNQSDPASFSQAASFSQVAANGAPVRLTGRGNRRESRRRSKARRRRMKSKKNKKQRRRLRERKRGRGMRERKKIVPDIQNN